MPVLVTPRTGTKKDEVELRLVLFSPGLKVRSGPVARLEAFDALECFDDGLMACGE